MKVPALETTRGRGVLRLVALAAAAVCLPALLRPSGSYEDLDDLMDIDGEDLRALEATLNAPLDERDYREVAIPEELKDVDLGDGEELTALLERVSEGLLDNPKKDLELPQYNLADAVEVGQSTFSNMYGVFVYDPEEDTFAFYSVMMRQMAKINVGVRLLSFSLRQLFPERFCGKGCDEFAIAISGGDYPHLNKECFESFPHTSEDCPGHFAPIFNFGSAYRHREILPNMLAMPMPGWTHSTAIGNYIENPMKSPLTFTDWEEQLDEKWEDLIPQVVWRGSDFGYLNHFELLAGTSFEAYLGGLDESLGETERREAATRAMRESYNELRPRWRGVVWTAEAEREAEANNAEAEDDEGGKEALPWANIKFKSASAGMNYSGRAAKYLTKDMYNHFVDAGIPAIGDGMKSKELARFKYQIDLGGGGGTTWTGTTQKLQMPGLLFHHVTPTIDYIHYRLKPWYHYVPIAPNLSDLEEKFDWAQSHPRAARKIAAQGTKVMRDLATKEGYEAMFDEEYLLPLTKALEAYVPVRMSHPGKHWKEVIEGISPNTIYKYHCGGNFFSRRCSV